MRNISIKNDMKFLGIIILLIFALVVGMFALNFNGASVYAHSAEIECCDDEHEHEHSVQPTFSSLNGNVFLDQVYLSAHYADGTMGMVIDETYDPDEIIFEPFSFTHLQRTTVRSSGKPDNQSIVAVFLGDGFTSDEQQNFLDRVTEIANYMITVEPFNYYKDYLTVYAVHSISSQSGVSGEVGGAFACLDSSGNPTTPQCTPIDSSIFNCIHGRDTFYNSYYQFRSSANRVILEMASADRTRARNHALAASFSANMVQIIANSAVRGGTGQMPTSSQPLGVALTSINTSNPSGDWTEVVMHEFGHSFGGLGDEYWNGSTPAEYPNMTKTSSISTVKWSQWVGYKNVGVYPFAANERDGNSNQATNPWYRPHQNCKMRQTGNSFCPVCVQELLSRMATATGITLFNTTNIGTNNIRIDRLNLIFSGSFNVPERINGRVVTEIGASAFTNRTQLSQITIPLSITNIGGNAFKDTNKAPIYLTGRTSVLNTFDKNWNSSENPVYLNGNLCSHPTKTKIELNATQHGDLCSYCRTVTNKVNHRKYTSNGWDYCYDCSYSKPHTHSYTPTWINYKLHELKCSCGNVTNLIGHVVSGGWNGIGYATCLECGGPAEIGIVGPSYKIGKTNQLLEIFVLDYFGNGSFILNNGVIVLSDKDLVHYYNGTLVIPVIGSHMDCCKHENLDIEIVNDYLYYDIDKTKYGFILTSKKQIEIYKYK